MRVAVSRYTLRKDWGCGLVDGMNIIYEGDMLCRCLVYQPERSLTVISQQGKLLALLTDREATKKISVTKGVTVQGVDLMRLSGTDVVVDALYTEQGVLMFTNNGKARGYAVDDITRVNRNSNLEKLVKGVLVKYVQTSDSVIKIKEVSTKTVTVPSGKTVYNKDTKSLSTAVNKGEVSASMVVASDAPAYIPNSDGDIKVYKLRDLKTITAAADKSVAVNYAITGFDYTAEGTIAARNVNKSVELTLDKDCVFIAVNSKDEEGMEGGMEGVQFANPAATANKYIPNAVMVTIKDGTEDKVVAVVYDANNVDWESVKALEF